MLGVTLCDEMSNTERGIVEMVEVNLIDDSFVNL
jgi:hypothetical protein